MDLEKAYERVPRDLVYRCFPEKLIRLVQATYTQAKTVVRTCYCCTDKFQIDAGLHQGSVLSPFLFTTVLGTISEEFGEESFMELLFADN